MEMERGKRKREDNVILLVLVVMLCCVMLRGADAEKVTETRYIELPPMKPGEVLFTEPQRTRISMPEGRVAIQSVHAFIVEATNASFVNNGDNFEEEAQEREIPLSEVYNHHWIAVDLSLPKYTRDFDVYAERAREQDVSFANGPCEALKVRRRQQFCHQCRISRWGYYSPSLALVLFVSTSY